MSEDVRTKLQAYASGQNMRKRQSTKRKTLTKKEKVQEPTVEIQPIEYATQAIEDTANVLFKPIPCPLTNTIAAAERGAIKGGSPSGGMF